jgi:isopenicillin N synthase-like dioxygenase
MLRYEGFDGFGSLCDNRYSIAYFCNPNFDSEITVIPTTCKEDEKPKYESVNSGKYLVKRLAATY